MIKTKYPKTLKWRCHTPNLLNDIIVNINPQGLETVRIPLNIFSNLLAQIAERASELNDPKLNALMCRLTLYEIADPESKDYNLKLLNKTLKQE